MILIRMKLKTALALLVTLLKALTVEAKQFSTQLPVFPTHPSARQRRRQLAQLLCKTSQQLSSKAMSIQSASRGMTFACPYIPDNYTIGEREVITVDFLVVNQHERFFCLNVVNKNVLELAIIVPKATV